MLPRTQAELDKTRDECYSMVTTRATMSAGTSAIPTPGVDIAADLAIMMELLPAINRKFGLTPEQIEGYSETNKKLLYQVLKQAGKALVGQTVTKALVGQALKKIAGRAATKQVLKFVPVVGWFANAAIGFGAMKYMGNSHVDDCYDVCKKIIMTDNLPG